jgi:hypothetical protein
MKPLSCKACGLQIGANDPRCPHCGRRNWSGAYSNFWEALLWEALTAVVILILFAYLGIR